MQVREDSGLDEFIIFPQTESQQEVASLGLQINDAKGRNLNDARSAFSWTRANTLILLDFYKKYRSHVGTFQIRNFKKLWETISHIFKGKYGIDVTASNCENRWRVLERNFKKWIDNKNQTGAGRKFFEYAEEMNAIMGKKKNINPTVLISSSTISELPDINQEIEETTPRTVTLEAIADDANSLDNFNLGTPLSTASRKRKLQFPRTRITKPKNNDFLERIRKDKEERHKERMGHDKEIFERMYALEVKKQESREKRNELLKENNNLQREGNNVLAKILRSRSLQL